jgi:hypothetical protein
MKDKVEYFTEKLNKLRIKEAFYNSSGYETPAYIKQEMRLAEITLKSLNKKK